MNTTNCSIPILTVAVCTYNRAPILARCIEYLLHQDVPHTYFNILVVDNSSTDDTQSVVKKIVSKTKNLRYCLEQQAGLSSARNRALQESNTPYVAFIDDDSFVPSHWVASTIETIADKQPLIIGGPIRPHHDTTPPSWYPTNIEYNCEHIPHGWVNAPAIFGGNFAVHKITALACGGFDPHLGMIHGQEKYHEETALAHSFLKHGHRVYFSHSMWNRHLVSHNRYSYFFQGYNNYLKGRDAGGMEGTQYAREHSFSTQYLQQQLRYQLHRMFFNTTVTGRRGTAKTLRSSVANSAIKEQKKIAHAMRHLGHIVSQIKRRLSNKRLANDG